MSLPRHFNQRPRRRLAPPPQRGVSVREPEPEVLAEPEVLEAAVEPVAEVAVETEAGAPTWNTAMKKAELLAVALGLGLAVTETNTKAEIVEALRSV